MKIPRRSLSASVGAWCVQLVYTPRVAPEDGGSSVEATRALEVSLAVSPEASLGARRALLPAFAAVFVAVVAACYALAHFIELPVATRVLGLILCVAILVSWGARCGSPWLRRSCGAARWPLALMLTLCVLSLRWSEEFSRLLRGHPNMQAAVFCGFITLLSVLLIGARSGGRLVPVAAPLIPALSLLGLLCLVAVDGLTQACFLLFCAAALYLLCYDRFLRRAAPDLSSGVWNLAPHARRTQRGDAPVWALQSVLVSSVWFALFLSGGALLFWPLQALLPRVAIPRFQRGEGDNGGRKLDYSGGAPVMELRGGTHALSDRVLLRVTPLRGISTGLWRGRVYQDYDRSLWSERRGIVADKSRPSAPLHLIEPRPLGEDRGIKPQLAPAAGRVALISELVVPLGGVPDVVYSSGLPLKWQAQHQFFDIHDPQRINDLTRSQSPYLVQSFETQPNLRVLDATPGFNPNDPKISPELRQNLLRNLQLPSETSTRTILQAVVRRIKAGALPTHNPSEKARAVADYLRRNCVYSLQAPAVPPTADATAFFLSDARSGACDMFASSMALLLRAMGVPARVATGFLDSQTPESATVDSGGATVKILRERDSHAWVEYYVPNYGWLTIDPTQNTREAPPTLGARLADLFHLSRLGLSPVLWALPLLGLTLLLAGLLWQRRESKNSRNHTNERQFIEAAYAQSLRLLRRRVPHAAHLAPGEYEARVLAADVPAAAKQEFAALTHLYRATRYGPLTEYNRADVAACLARLKIALKSGVRANY